MSGAAGGSAASRAPRAAPPGGGAARRPWAAGEAAAAAGGEGAEGDRLQLLLRSCRQRQVAEGLLAVRADLHTAFEFGLPSGALATGTALAAAAAWGAVEAVEALVEAGAPPADPGSFRWRAGLFGTLWEGPPACAAATAGRLDSLRLLARQRVELDGPLARLQGSPNATLLYEACCRGHVEVARYLARRGRDLDRPATHHEDPGLRVTPLHAAAAAGACEVVEVLLSARANVEARNREDDIGAMSPLNEAIENGQYRVVRLLVERSADLFASAPGGTCGIDHLFGKNDMVTIGAAAEGLQRAKESTVRRLTVEQLVNFLSTPGEAPANILAAVFRPRRIRHWQHAKAIDWKTAYIDRGKNINAAAGPDAEFFVGQFARAQASAKKMRRDHAEPMSQEERGFLDTLLPQTSPAGSARRRRASTTQVPVDLLQCVLRDIHRAPEVLYAIAEGPLSIFDEHGCQAIVLLGWKEAWRLYCATFAVHVLQASLLLAASICLNEEEAPELRWLFAAPMLALWLYNALLEALQLEGFRRMGKLRKYILSWDNVVDAARLAMTLGTVLLLAFSWEALLVSGGTPGSGRRLVVGLTALFRWTKVLYEMRGFAAIGPRMLPVLEALGSALPFVSVVAFPLVGLVHMYYVLGIQVGAWGLDAFFLVYRLGILGDFDIAELEGSGRGDNQSWTFLGGWVRVLIVGSTFLIAIVMMNIFIGVLGESYAEAYGRRDSLFMRQLASNVLDSTARREALLGCCTWRCGDAAAGAAGGGAGGGGAGGGVGRGRRRQAKVADEAGVATAPGEDAAAELEPRGACSACGSGSLRAAAGDAGGQAAVGDHGPPPTPPLGYVWYCRRSWRVPEALTSQLGDEDARSAGDAVVLSELAALRQEQERAAGQMANLDDAVRELSNNLRQALQAGDAFGRDEQPHHEGRARPAAGGARGGAAAGGGARPREGASPRGCSGVDLEGTFAEAEEVLLGRFC